jgi:hypothetical protein
MGGIPEAEKGLWIDMGLNYYIGIEEEFNKKAKTYNNR